MEYNRIPVVLKRYSFASKMQACTIESMKTMDFMSTVSPEILRTLILPWDIETFVIFAVKAQEYNNLDIRDKNGKYFYEIMQTSVYKGYKRDKIEMRGDRAEISDFPLYLNTVAGGLDCRDQTIGGFSFVVKIYAVPVVEIIG